MTSGLQHPEEALRGRVAQLPAARRAELLARLRGEPAPATDSWWVRYNEQAAPALRLFCFTYAGGSAALFRPLADALPPDVEVWSAQLPGRGPRASEPAHRRIEPLIEDLHRAIEPQPAGTAGNDVPFAFFGYSMGALVAFELTRRLRVAGAPLPATLLLAAFRAPQLPNPNIKIHRMPDEVLKTVLLKEGTPRAVVEDETLMQAALPTLRADLELCDTYRFEAQPPLDVPMSMFGGEYDVRVPRTDIEQWRVQTTADFRLTMLPGPHFFVHSDRDQLFEQVSQELADVPRHGRNDHDRPTEH